MRRVLVCGASGFLGYHIFQRLLQRPDLDVHGTYLTNRYGRVNPENSHLRKINFLNPGEAMRATEGFDAIILAAANSSGSKDVKERPYLHVTDNNIINSLIFRAAHENNVRQVIFPSCTVIYPDSLIPLKETDIDFNAPLSPAYLGGGWMKLYHEKQCEFFSTLGRTRYTIMRHSNIYGPHDRFDLERSHVTAATIAKVMNSSVTVTVWGQGLEMRDILYVDDFIDFVELALEKQNYAYGIFNVGAGQTISIRELVEEIIRISGRKLDINYDPAGPSIGTRIAIDISKARDTFGWSPRTSLQEGLGKTISWYNLNRPPLHL